MSLTSKKIVFYDGDCGFCNRSVDFILRHEKDHTLFFAALQSDFTRNFLRERGLALPDLNTIIFFDGINFSYRSDAVLKIAQHLRSPYSWVTFSKWIPATLRDVFYSLIARNRKRLGKFQCSVRDTDQLERFLDVNPAGLQTE